MVKTSLKQRTKSPLFWIGLFIVLIIFILILVLIFDSTDKTSTNITNTNTSVSSKNSTNLPVIRENDNIKVSKNLESGRVELWIEGGVIANEEQQTLHFIIDKDRRIVKLLKGYELEEVKRIELMNNRDAYDAFTLALDSLNFGYERLEESDLSYREACPESSHYRMIYKESLNTTFDRWFTICGKIRYGTYGGKVDRVNRLFQAQFINTDGIFDNFSFN
jgi:hypothetical protein